MAHRTETTKKREDVGTTTEGTSEMTVSPSQVSIVIPALNEEAHIGLLVSSLRLRFPKAEVIVVNDGSTDSTAERAEVAGSRVISHNRQLGYGAALRTGIEMSCREYVLFCDGDGQHSVDDVGLLIKECEGYDMVIGARGSDSHSPFLRRPGKMLLRWFANYLAGEEIPDLNSGLRIFKREVIVRYLHLMPQGFSFSTTSTFAILKSSRRYKYKYVPINVAKRVGNKSTVRQLRHGPQTLLLMLRLSVLFEPLKVFLTMAGIQVGYFLPCKVVGEPAQEHLPWTT